MVRRDHGDREWVLVNVFVQNNDIGNGRECCLFHTIYFPAGAIALADSLRGKSQLTYLFFKNNVIEDEGALALAHAASSSMDLKTFDLSWNPITPDAVAQIRELVPVLTFVAPVSECPSLCPGGTLHFPDALHMPSNTLCSEREAFCAANEGSCGTCGEMQFEATSSTDCCGLRTACTLEQMCSPDLTLDRIELLYRPGRKLSGFSCRAMNGLRASSRYVSENFEKNPPMACSELPLYLANHTDCCTATKWEPF